MVTPQEISQFQAFIQRYYQNYSRRNLPWRQDYDPYKILISEIMLQQTQVERVVPKFLAFLRAFPTVYDLANSSPAQVIIQWQGLGYNRRGLNLQRAAQKIVTDFQGQVPSETDDLLSLPGIGPYTAAAIQAFAFNQPSIVIETNIRTVLIYHFFPQAYDVEDKDLRELLEVSLDQKNPRAWYSALMDYGTYLKQVLPNPSRRSKQYVKQSKFEGSLRQVRGGILKIATKGPISQSKLYFHLPFAPEKLDLALEQLIKEGFLTPKQGKIRLNE